MHLINDSPIKERLIALEEDKFSDNTSVVNSGDKDNTRFSLVSEADFKSRVSMVDYSRRNFKHSKMIKTLNFVCYILVTGGLFFSYFLKPETCLLHLNAVDVYIPINLYFMVGCWSVVLSAQGVFACIPLCYGTDKFDDLVLRRISYWYAITSGLFVVYIFAFAFSYTIGTAWIPFGIITVIKFLTMNMLYGRIKYVDEGQYYVGYIEFVCLHLMNSINNSWYSYLFLHSLSKIFRTHAILDNLVEKYAGVVITITLITLIVESAVYLAYYKDIFFAAMTWAILFGVLLLLPENIFSIVILLIISGGFTLLTILRHREKVVYMNYSKKITRTLGKAKKKDYLGLEPRLSQSRSSYDRKESVDFMMSKDVERIFEGLGIYRNETVYIKDVNSSH